MEQINTKTTQPAFSIIGIQTRTTNAQEMAGAGRIGKLWQQFQTDSIFSKISQPLEQNVYAVYHGYESDMNGEYTLTIGLKVKSDADIPTGCHKIQIPQQSYTKYTTAQGPMPQIVIDCWQNIWQSNLNRAYTFDYELYDERCADMSKAQLDVFIAM